MRAGLATFAKGQETHPEAARPAACAGALEPGVDEAQAGLPLPALTLVRVEVEEEALPGVLAHWAGEAELQLIEAPGLQGFSELQHQVLHAVQKTGVRSLGQDDPLEEGIAMALQYSCLENPMDRGTWQATVMGSERRSSSSAPRRGSAEPRPRGCSGLGEPRPALPSF